MATVSDLRCHKAQYATYRHYPNMWICSVQQARSSWINQWVLQKWNDVDADQWLVPAQTPPVHTQNLSRIIPDAHQFWAAATRDRLRLLPPASRQPITNISTASLLHHETGGGTPGEEKIMICWQVRVVSEIMHEMTSMISQVRVSKTPKQIDANLGSGAKRWAVSMFMTGE